MPSRLHPAHSAGRSTSPTGKLRVTGYTDQDNEKWVRISSPEAFAFGRVSDLANNATGFWGDLSARGVLIIAPQTRADIVRQVQALKFEHEAHRVDGFGWHGEHYFSPFEDMPKKLDDVRVIMDLPAATIWSSSGALETWKAEVRRLCLGQNLPIFVLAASMLPQVLPLTQLEENPLIELVGPSSIGKTSMMRLAASVYGRSDDLMKSWHTTPAGLETSMAEAHGGLLLLDEGSLRAGSMAADLPQAIHALAQGRAKARHHEPVGQRYRFAVFSTSNVPLLEVVGRRSTDELGGINVRMITVPADAGGSSILDTVPAGCQDHKAAVDALNALARDHRGVAVAAIGTKLAGWNRTRDPRLRFETRIARSMARFVEKTDAAATGMEGRVLKLFAAIHAAGVFASRLRVLPFSEPEIGRAVREVYRRCRRAQALVASSSPTDAIGTVRAYVERERARLVQVKKGVYLPMTIDELDAAPGFLTLESGHGWLMVRSARWQAVFGSKARSLLAELKAQSLLRTPNEGWHHQAYLRSAKIKDRFYCVRLD